MRTIFGEDLGVGEPVWASRFRSERRHAAHYRAGRVLLAGDAAHTHLPSGGQGLQDGIHDAFDLGWKLAAELRGWAPPGLLDTYETERRPIAAAILRKTELAFRFETSDSVLARLVRWITMRAMSIGPLQAGILREFAGLNLRYPRGDGHRMVGRRLPDGPLDQGGRRFELFQDSTFVLLTDNSSAVSVADQWAGRVRTTRVRDLPVASVLVRPDGYVAWAGETGLSEALHRWCGEKSAVSDAAGA